MTARTAAIIPLLIGLGLPLAAQYTEQALALGVDHYSHDPHGMAGGVAILDYDNDGYQDIYLTGGQAPDVLYHNQGDGTFIDVTRELGITFFNIVKTMGVVAGDFDDDGYTDLFVTTAGGAACHLLRNEGGRRFRDVSRAAGIRHEAWSSSATLADYDADGDLDVYVGNYVSFDAEPFEQHITGAQPDFLYRNEGNGRFTLLPTPLPEARTGCTLATLFSDYDRDGRSDLFVLNDFGDFYEPNNLLRNEGGDVPAFERVSQSTHVRAAINSMGIAGGDLNEDGIDDYYITNIGDNRLYVRSGDGPFAEVAKKHSVNDGTGMSWGTVIQDFDNDGHLDLYVNKGYLYGTDIAQFNRLYLGSGADMSFEDRSRYLAVPGVNNKARGVAWGDLNNDGAIDLIISGIRQDEAHSARTLIYLNEGSEGNWLKIKLGGTTANAAAIGARLTLHANGRRIERELTAGGSYLSSSENTVHFGLGTIAAIDSLVVKWPLPGAREAFSIPAVNTTYRLTERGATTSIPSLRSFAQATPYKVYPQPLHEPGRLSWSAPAYTPQSVEITDLTGRSLQHLSFAEEQARGRVELSGLHQLAPGTYLLRIASQAGLRTEKVIVQ